MHGKIYKKHFNLNFSMYFLKLCYFGLDKTYKFWSRVLALLTVTLWLTAFGGVVGHFESQNLLDFFSGSWTSKWMNCGGFQVLLV